MKKHFIEVENSEEVAAVHHEASSNKWIFLCHGFGSNKEGSYEKRAERAVEEGFNAVRFDFRGNGESDGEFIDQNLSSRIKDLEAVIDYFNPEEIFLYGMSFGGKVVIHSAEDLECEALILKSPVTFNDIMDKFRSVVDEKGSYNHFDDKTVDNSFFEDFDKYSFDEPSKILDCPVAFFHGSEDSTVHFEKSLEAFGKISSDSALFRLKGEKHSLTEEAEIRMQDLMFSWLHSLTPEPK